jgi:hypothetical protein
VAVRVSTPAVAQIGEAQSAVGRATALFENHFFEFLLTVQPIFNYDSDSSVPWLEKRH